MEDIELSTLISDIRFDLANLTPDLIADEGILPNLKRSKVYINNIIDPAFSDVDFYKEALVALATYYTFADIVAQQSVNLETIPPFTWQQNSMYKNIALSYIRQITNLPIKDDLSINYSILSKRRMSNVALTRSVWE